MKIKIRKIKVTEAMQVSELVDKVLQEDFMMWPKKVIDVYRKHIFTEKYFKDVIKNKGIIFGAREKRTLLGTIVVMTKDFGGVSYIDWLAVAKKHRNKGIATQLIKEAENWLTKNNFHYSYLNTEAEKNIAFYKKRGYEYVGLQKKAWFGMDTHIMQKILRNKPFEEIFSKRP